MGCTKCRKKINTNKLKSTIKQKAIQSYMLAGRVTHSLTSMMVICANLVKDKKYNYAEIYNNKSDTSSETIEQLELLIIENFYDLNPQLFKIEKCIKFDFLYKIV